ncbi:hypothetical protein Tco_1215697 [Tanacetum coccineum]
MTHDLPEGVVRFANGDNEVAYKIPHKIEQYNSLSNLEKEHTKSVYFRNEEDKRRGVDYVMSKILGFYKECLELGRNLSGVASEMASLYIRCLTDESICYRCTLDVQRMSRYMVPYEAFACRCGAGDVVLRELYKPKTRDKLYYACPRSKDLQHLHAILQKLQEMQSILQSFKKWQSAQTASTCMIRNVLEAMNDYRSLKTSLELYYKCEIAPEATAVVIVSSLTATPDLAIESDPKVEPSKALPSETPPSPDYDEFEPIKDALETAETLPAQVAPPVHNTPILPISFTEPTPVIPHDT